MRMFIYGDGEGKYYCGCNFLGQPEFTTNYTSAYMFEQPVRDEEDSQFPNDLNLQLFQIEISEPITVSDDEDVYLDSPLSKFRIQRIDLFRDK